MSRRVEVCQTCGKTHRSYDTAILSNCDGPFKTEERVGRCDVIHGP